MSILIISIIVSIILMVVIGVVVTIFNKKGNLNKRGYLLIPLGLVGMALLLTQTFVTINANEVGIVYDDFGGLQDKVYKEGFKTKSIFEHITKISTANRTEQLETAAQTKDSSYATFQVTVIYKIEAENAGKFYKSTGSTEISQQQLASLVKEALQSSTSEYEIYSILGEDLETVRVRFTEQLSKILDERYSITIISTSFDDIDAGTRIEEIIKNKAEAQQQIEIAEAEQKKAEVEAATAQIKALADATVAKIKAESEAEVLGIGAEAEAKKIEIEKLAIIKLIDNIYAQNKDTLTYAQCSEIVLQTIFYENWDGKLPDVLTSDSLSSLIGSLIG